MNTKMPYLVNFALTNKCNMNCLHCYSAGFRDIGNELTYEEVTKIINELADLKIFEIFFDGGESLLQNDFVKICNYVSDIGMNFSFSTNGLLITKNIIDELINADISRIQISLDGAIPSSHDTFRRMSGSFEKAIYSIEILQKRKIYIVVACTISKYNYQELNKLINLCINLGVKELVFIRPIHTGNAKINDSFFLDNKLLNSIYIDLIYKKIHLKDQLKISIAHNPLIIPLVEKLDISSKIKSDLIQEATCSAGKTMCWINSNGDVTPCPLIHLKLGNIREKSFEEIWSGHKILNDLRNIKQVINEDCLSCKFFDLCSGGCHAEAYATSNNLFAKDPMCEL